MPEDNLLEEAMRDLLIDICEVMYRRGYDTVPIGAIMQLVGVAPERAKLHDGEYFALDDDFLKILEQRREPVPKQVPHGTTLH